MPDRKFFSFAVLEAVGCLASSSCSFRALALRLGPWVALPGRLFGRLSSARFLGSLCRARLSLLWHVQDAIPLFSLDAVQLASFFREREGMNKISEQNQ